MDDAAFFRLDARAVFREYICSRHSKSSIPSHAGTYDLPHLPRDPQAGERWLLLIEACRGVDPRAIEAATILWCVSLGEIEADELEVCPDGGGTVMVRRKRPIEPTFQHVAHALGTTRRHVRDMITSAEDIIRTNVSRMKVMRRAA